MKDLQGNGKYGSPWSRDELVLALYLYCQIPFAQTKTSNTQIQYLAHFLGRTPSSVARKLGNFGAFDPMLAEKGITGLTHYSKADRHVWEEFSNRWDALVEESRVLLMQGNPSSVPHVLKRQDIDDLPIISIPTGPTQEPRVVMARLLQSFFRKTVLASYQSICCVCGLDLPPLLLASHIMPWSVREDTRTDPQNGLCLCALHDKAFDRGFLSVTPHYKVAVSPLAHMSHAAFTHTTLLSFHDQPIRLPNRFLPKAEYLLWHNETVLRA